MNVPEQFTVVVTEADRQTAGVFWDPEGCIIATAVKRMFPGSKATEATDAVLLDGVRYRHSWIRPSDLHFQGSPVVPHYGPEVVGFTLECLKG